MMSPCPSCKRDFTPESHPGGRCEEVNHGRRFFMMGALALPLAKKVTVAASPVLDVALYGIDPRVEFVVNRDAAGVYQVTYHWRDFANGLYGTRTITSEWVAAK